MVHQWYNTISSMIESGLKLVSSQPVEGNVSRFFKFLKFSNIFLKLQKTDRKLFWAKVNSIHHAATILLSSEHKRSLFFLLRSKTSLILFIYFIATTWLGFQIATTLKGCTKLGPILKIRILEKVWISKF